MCEHLTWYMGSTLSALSRDINFWSGLWPKNQNFLWFWFSDSSDSFLPWEEMLDARTCPSVNIVLGLMNRGLPWLVPYSVFGTNISSESCWFLLSSVKCGAVPSYSKWAERKKVEFWNASETPTCLSLPLNWKKESNLGAGWWWWWSGLLQQRRWGWNWLKRAEDKNHQLQSPLWVHVIAYTECPCALSSEPHKSPMKWVDIFLSFLGLNHFFPLICPRKDLRDLHSV